VTSEDEFWSVLRALWSPPADPRLAGLLPRDAHTLAGFYACLKAYVEDTPRAREGVIQPGALVAGDVVSSGPGSVIEAGAVIHESCRLVLGPRSRIRSGAVLRDEVVMGADCLIGAHCEVTRSVILGPRSYLGHFVYAGDSIIGADCIVAGNVMIANTKVDKGPISVKFGGRKIDSGRSHLGALVGDSVSFGASTTLCPGAVVLPGLRLPPAVVLYGTIDGRRRDALVERFFATWDGDD
jgi:NDP-sugar pyrophosphorylase family protein